MITMMMTPSMVQRRVRMNQNQPQLLKITKELVLKHLLPQTNLYSFKMQLRQNHKKLMIQVIDLTKWLSRGNNNLQVKGHLLAELDLVDQGWCMDLMLILEMITKA